MSDVNNRPNRPTVAQGDKDEELTRIVNKAVAEVDAFYESQYPGGKPRKRSLWEKLFG